MTARFDGLVAQTIPLSAPIMRYCSLCREYYRMDEQCGICPHDLLQRPETLNAYGWKMPPDTRVDMDAAYHNDDRDALRTYLSHSNPLVAGYAAAKIRALDLAQEIANKVQVYESTAQEPTKEFEGWWTRE